MLQGLTSRKGRADAQGDAPGPCGRTYAIPFGMVWDAAVALAGGGLRGWRIVSRDESAGVIVAQIDGRVLPFRSRVEISIGLDDNAQTRVDASTRGRNVGVDLGSDIRRLRWLLRSLDRSLAAKARRIPDAKATVDCAKTVES